MATRAGISGLAVGYISVGGLIAWSGIENQTIASTLKSLLSGMTPTPGAGQSISVAPPAASGGSAGEAIIGPAESAGSVNVTAPGSGTDAANQALGRLMAAGYGWTGQQFTDLVQLWNDESGWNANARNAGSGAYGIAQSLGHGTANTAAFNAHFGITINEYGPDNGVSVATAKAANGGSAAAQIAWGLAYIKATYGSPSAALAHENSFHWY
jgi:resuscitation-promoting factor RpfB